MNNPFNLFRSAIYRKKHFKKDVFPFYGFKFYFGEFGSGKTISCVDEVLNITKQYPKCVFISNTAISSVTNKTLYYRTAEELMKILLSFNYDVDNYGFIIMIDEAHVVLSHLLESTYAKTFIEFISQLRKIHIYIIGTSQLYSKNDKPIRDYMRQNGQLVFCFKVFPGLTLQKYVDMSDCKEDSKNQLVYNVSHVKRLYHTPELYESYDTNAVVSEIKSIGRKGMSQIAN